MEVVRLLLLLLLEARNERSNKAGLSQRQGCQMGHLLLFVMYWSVFRFET